jgi:hypothetical protein
MCAQKQPKISGHCVWVIKALVSQLENLCISKDVHFIEVRFKDEMITFFLKLNLFSHVQYNY